MSKNKLSEMEWARGNKSELLDLTYTAQLSNNKAKESWLLQEGARDPNKDLNTVNAQLTAQQAKEEYQCKSRDKVEILEDGTREYISIKTVVAVKSGKKTNHYLPLRVAVGNLDENNKFINYNRHNDLNDVYRALNVKYVDVIYPTEASTIYPTKIVRFESEAISDYIYNYRDRDGYIDTRIKEAIENRPYCYTEGKKNSTGWIIGYEGSIENTRHIKTHGEDKPAGLVIGLRENYPTNLKEGELPRLDRYNRWSVFLLIPVNLNSDGLLFKKAVNIVEVKEE